MGTIVFPWSLVCLAHPLGHDHHEHHDGPSPCELRAQHDGKTEVYWPPMNCKHLHVGIHEIQKPEVKKISLPFFEVDAIQLVFESNLVEKATTVFLFPPDQKCRSATLISANALRGPPLS